MSPGSAGPPQRHCEPLRDSRLDRLPPTSNSWRTSSYLRHDSFRKPASTFSGSCRRRHDRADRPPLQEAPWQPDRDSCAADCLGAGRRGKKAVTVSLAEIIIPPNFRPPTALLDCDTRPPPCPALFASRFLTPSP